VFVLGVFAFSPADKGKEVVVSAFTCAALALVHWDLLPSLMLPLGLFCSIFSFKGSIEFLLVVCLSLLVVHFIIGFTYVLWNLLVKTQVKMVNIRDSSSGLHIVVLTKRCQSEGKKLLGFILKLDVLRSM